MAKIGIVHTTEYTYRNPVGLLRHKLMVRPDESHDLRLHSATLKVEPEPNAIYWKHDVFNNSICYLEWPEALRTERHSIVSTLDMTHHPDGQPLPVSASTQPPRSFRFPTPLTRFPISRASPNARCRTPNERLTPGPAVLRRRWRASRRCACWKRRRTRSRRSFVINARYEEGTQTAAQTVALGSGTCRDFAVLMMEALRSFGLATRFVTGYLYDDSSGTTVGGGSTHAWCSVYLPGAGWTEYDPTNGLIAGANLIRVGVTGRRSRPA